MMKGWKTWIAVLVAFMSALVLIGQGFIADPMDWELIKQGITALIAAFGMLGLGHKLEKNGKKQLIPEGGRKVEMKTAITLLYMLITVIQTDPFLLMNISKETTEALKRDILKAVEKEYREKFEKFDERLDRHDIEIGIVKKAIEWIETMYKTILFGIGGLYLTIGLTWWHAMRKIRKANGYAANTGKS